MASSKCRANPAAGHTLRSLRYLSLQTARSTSLDKGELLAGLFFAEHCLSRPSMSSGTHSRQGRAIPPLLEPIVRLPKEKTLLLLTGVLGATPHWIVSRFLKSVLSDDRHDNGDDDREQTAVVLVSWMRDLEYWKAEARRGAVRGCFAGYF